MTKKAVIQILIATSALVFCAYFTRDLFGVPFAGVAMCLALFFVLALISLIFKRKRVGEDYISAKEISAFKMYDKMQFYAKIAFYIAVLSFFNTVLMDAEQSFWDVLLYLFTVISCGIIAIAIIYFAFAKKAAQNFDKINVFVLGTAIWLAASLFVYHKVFYVTAVAYLFDCIGLGLMYASLKFINADVKNAMTLVEVDSRSFERFESYANSNAQLTAYAILALLCSIFAVIPSISHLFWQAVLLLPAALYIVACVFALFQPLDSQNLDKLVVYRSAEGMSDAVKYSLTDRIVHGKNRVGIRIMIWFIRPWFPCKCVGKEKLKNIDRPIVFVGNHYEIYGPVVSVLRMPVPFRPWVIWKMMDSDQIEEYIRVGVENLCKVVPKFIRKKIPRIGKKFMLYIFECIRSIPVYRDNLRQVVQTINMTVQAMEEGDNVMLFPEKPETTYSQGGVDNFYSGFVEVGSAYYKKTGKCATFVPVYISKKHRKLYIGDGITYDASNGKADEKRRIASELRQRMLQMAEEANKKKSDKDD